MIDILSFVGFISSCLTIEETARCGIKEFLNKQDKFDIGNNTISDENVIYSMDKFKSYLLNNNPVCISEDEIRQIKDKFYSENRIGYLEQREVDTKIDDIFEEINKYLEKCIDIGEKLILEKIRSQEKELRDIKEAIKEKQIEKTTDNEDEEYILGLANEIKTTFVKTSAYNKAINQINNDNIVILVGDSGIGKSNASIMLASEIFTGGYEIKYLEGVDEEEVSDVISSIRMLKRSVSKKQVIIFDDFLGKTKANDTQYYLGVIEDFIKTIRLSPNKKLILSSRKTIIDSIMTHSESIKSLIEHNCKIINLNTLLESEDRVNILCRYAIKNSMQEKIKELANDRRLVAKIIKHDNYTPLVIYNAMEKCKEPSSQDYGNIILNLLEHPDFMWEQEFRALNELSYSYLCILYSLTDSFINQKIVKECYEFYTGKMQIRKSESFSHTIERLNNLVVSNKKGQIKLRHPSIGEYINKKMSDEIREKILSNAIYIEQIVRLDDSENIIMQKVKDRSIFELETLPIELRISNSRESICFNSCIEAKYLWYINKFNILNSIYKSTIIDCIKVILNDNILLMLFGDIVIDVLNMKYDFSEVISDEKYVNQLYIHANQYSIWDLLKITVVKEKNGYNCKTMKDYIKSQVEICLGAIAVEAFNACAESIIEDYLEDNISIGEEYTEDDIDYLEEEIIDEIISEGSSTEAGEEAIREAIQKYELYNIEENEIVFEDNEEIRDLIREKIDEYFM